jgi:transcriptional regulator with XRE-family HTH domain
MPDVREQLIEAIRRSGQTRYQIAKGSGVGQSQLSRLVHGEVRMSLESIQKVAAYLGYEVALTKRRGR